ncbi:MAG: hypothetical protein HRU25_11045 [Psychrobium sp.]|nr:hypothetical protein [Psychrobium sp.]
MKTGSIVKYGLIVAVLGYVIFSNTGDNDAVKDEIDLNLVLDITVETLHTVSETVDENSDTELAFTQLADALAVDYNKSEPAIYNQRIGVNSRTDASLVAYGDTNGNNVLDDGESLLFMIEIDGEKSRIIASSNSGAVNDHYFSGTSLVAGYLIGSMLARQRGAGVTSKSLASKQPVTSRVAAKARAGSGSHSKGK